MGKAPARSANAELGQGMTDGSYKQVVKDRGGLVETGGASVFLKFESCHEKIDKDLRLFRSLGRGGCDGS